jgi:4-hydroxy-tetrahydrodipicolinate synthase
MIYLEGNPTGIKVLMDVMGLCKNHLRLPLVGASKTLTLRLEAELKKLMPIQTTQS